MVEHISKYNLKELSKIDLNCFPSDNLGWAVAERFPTEEYLKVKKSFETEAEPVTALCDWQADENYLDYINMAAYNCAGSFTIVIDDDEMMTCRDDDEYYGVEIHLKATSQEDIDYIMSIVEETHIAKVVLN